jgi:spore maturation protein CgeB
VGNEYIAKYQTEQVASEMGISNILVIGENVGRTKQRVNAMRRLGYSVDVLSSVPDDLKPGINDHITFFDRVWHKLGFPRDKTHLNTRVLLQLHKKKYDVMWVEKSLILKPSTLKKIIKTQLVSKIVWFSEDDMFAHHNQSYYFVKSLPYYDLIFTTKSYNCSPQELPAMGAKRVVFVNKTYDPEFHRPIHLSSDDKNKFATDVGFIGTFEQDRFEKMRYLAEKGIQVRIWGNGWKHVMNAHPNLHIENKPIYDADYVKAIIATKINLCFLRKINRDLQTDRTAEIPACGAFMLAERTNEHLGLFEENKEAAYFDITNPEALLDSVNYYLTHEDERLAIARAGLQRCIDGKYSHDEQLRYMFECL